MIKTVTLFGKEIKVEDLGGFNTIVHNLGGDAIYASKYPDIKAGADDVAEVPAGAAKLISTTDGTVYLFGTGRVELTGQDHNSVNFKLPSSSGDGGGTSDVTKAYVNEQDASNLLENWYFADPINQKGQRKYTTSGYTIDRWKSNYGGDTLEINEEGYISFTAGDKTAAIYQLLENPAQYVGVTLTFSVLYKCSKPKNFMIQIFGQNGDLKESAVTELPQAEEWSMAYVTKKIENKNIYLRPTIGNTDTVTPGDTIDILAVKLELGDRQTLAHQDKSGNWILNDPPPNKALELAKCQRYQYVLRGGLNVVVGTFMSHTGSMLTIPLPVTMRNTTPEILIKGTARVIINGPTRLHQGFISNDSGFKNVYLGENTISVTLDDTQTGIQYHEYGFVDLKDTTSYIIIDNNL